MIRPSIAAGVVVLLVASSVSLRAPVARAQQSVEPDFSYGYGVIYDEIITADAALAVDSCQTLDALLAQPGSGNETADAQARHDAFVALADAWGRVQAIYILGGLEEDAVDYPLLIDTFHVGKEDIASKLARAIDSDGDPKTALFKNAYRTVTALDYLMFSGPWSPRRAALSQVAADTVCGRLDTLHADYLAQRESYLSDPQQVLALMIDAVIQSAYKTRDWRIGEVAGLTRKTDGRITPANAQFPHNLDASWAAIGAIIDTHYKLLVQGNSINIVTLSVGSGGNSLPQVQTALRKAQGIYDASSVEDYTDTAAMEPLYNALKDVQAALYDHVAGALGVAAGLVDSDGD